MTVDFHTHTFPDKIAAATIEKLSQTGAVPFTDGTRGGLLRSMKDAGVDISIVLPVVTNPDKTDKINASAAKTNAENTGIISFAGIHPDTSNVRQTLKNAAAMGFKGIKLHPEYQQTDFDDIRYLRILECAEELELITVVHAGFDIGYPESHRCYTDNVLNVLKNITPKRLVLAHMGGHSIWKDVKKYLAGADVYFDTALAYGKKQKIDTLLTEEQFIELSKAHGINKILFATDSPWSEQREMKNFVLNCPLTDDEKDMILYKNAAELLRL